MEMNRWERERPRQREWKEGERRGTTQTEDGIVCTVTGQRRGTIAGCTGLALDKKERKEERQGKPATV